MVVGDRRLFELAEELTGYHIIEKLLLFVSNTLPGRMRTGFKVSQP